MTTSLVLRALIMAYNLRRPPRVWCSTVIVDRSTPASGTDGSSTASVSEPVWVMLVPAGTTPLLNDFLVV